MAKFCSFQKDTEEFLTLYLLSRTSLLCFITTILALSLSLLVLASIPNPLVTCLAGWPLYVTDKVTRAKACITSGIAMIYRALENCKLALQHRLHEGNSESPLLRRIILVGGLYVKDTIVSEMPSKLIKPLMHSLNMMKPPNFILPL